MNRLSLWGKLKKSWGKGKGKSQQRNLWGCFFTAPTVYQILMQAPVGENIDRSNLRQSVCVSWPLSFKWEGKPQFCSVKTYASEHNLPPEKELIGTSSILAPGKSQVLPTDPLFTCKTNYIYNVADRRSAINGQEGGLAASKACLKALPLSLPSPSNFFALSPNREPVHRLYVAYSKLYKKKKERAEHTLRLKSDIKSVKLQFTKINKM